MEELSAKKALDILVPRIIGADHTHFIHTFRNKGDLLSNIPDRLSGYARWIPEDWHVVVLVDEDRQDCEELKGRLIRAAQRARLADRVLNRIAVEELEAWFLGDPEAVLSVYPRLPETFRRWKKFRHPDSVKGGTWEALDWLLTTNGYPEGLKKVSAAESIAQAMVPGRNDSPSFQVFKEGLEQLVA